MTAISPLQSVHKRGIFGNHHKKNQNDLIQISEKKDLTIIQVVKYKKSKINLSEINIDGLKFPEISPAVNANEETRILWSGPQVWLIVSHNENIFRMTKEKCDEQNFAITDISHSRGVIRIKGPEAKEVLKKGSPINFNKLKKNNCVGTVFQGINILIDMVEEKPEIFDIFVLRSFGESFYHDITDAALEDGYVAI